jgi:hypothetical protein
MDAIDQELNQLCGEVYDHLGAEAEYAQEDPLGPIKGLLSGLLFTLCAGLLFFFSAVIIRVFQ